MSQERVSYLDNASYSPMDPRALEAMLPFFKERYGNPSSPHAKGSEMKAALEGARSKVASLIGAERPVEIVFTSGSTEGINTALRGVAARNRDRGNHIVASAIEHVSVRNVLKHLSKSGFEVTYVPVDSNGIVDVDAVRRAVTEKTVLVTVMYANNEVGSIQPIKEIAEIAHSKKAYFHTDATAAAGKIPIDVAREGIDLMTVPSGDMGGPYGVGALYVKRGTRMEPLIIGGGQEGGLRSGTENVAGIAGMGMAAELAKAEMEAEGRRLSEIRDGIISRVLKGIPHSFLNGHPTRRLPGNVNLRFSFIEGESLVLSLDMEGIEVSSGSACSSKTLEPSHVLIAMGIDHAEAQGSLLISLGRRTTKEDGIRLTDALPNIVKGLREMSPIAPPEVR